MTARHMMALVLGSILLALPQGSSSAAPLSRRSPVARFVPAHRPTTTPQRPPARFSSYAQIARTLRQRQFSDAYGALNQRVSLALGQPDLDMVDLLPAAASAVDAIGESGTGSNNQVAGVDEADVVKTDGTFLYTLSPSRLTVIRGAQVMDDGAVQPLALVSSVGFGDDGFVPAELHLVGSFLIVVGVTYDYRFLTNPALLDSRTTPAKVARLVPFWGGTARTVLRVYDVSEPSAIVLVRTLEVEGTALSSRRIGQYLYVLTRAYPRLDRAAASARSTAPPGLVPRVGDSLEGNGLRDLRPAEVKVLPGCYEASYLVVAALDLGSADGEFRPQAFLGGGNVVYVSASSLYVASSSWFWRPLRALAAPAASVAAETEPEVVRLLRFELTGTTVQFSAQGTVPGRLLNSFSMDEREGVFRVATTVYPALWTEAGETSSVYTFDLGLNRLGAVEGLAPGERIYAARFLGERCYLVTFETIDPLFVVDLADPTRPQVLGELKVPGYSSYLHPFDDTHLIGFGKDVQRVTTSWSGPEGVPLEQGLKVSLFDVGEVTRPRELDAAYLGVRGSYSEALYDHHAFRFDAARGLLTFPCTLREFVDPADPAEAWWWGDFVFQGLVAYRLTIDGGFERLGAVTHMDEGETDVWDAPWDRTVRRGLMLGGLLHSVSESRVKANEASTLAEVSVLDLPREEETFTDPLVLWLSAERTATADEGVQTDSLVAGPLDAAETPSASITPASAVGELFRGFLEATR